MAMVFVSVFAAIALALTCQDASAFGSSSPSFIFSTTSSAASNNHRRHQSFQLFSTSEDTDLNKISSMRVSEIKQELESYGVSTRAFLEKDELVDALVKARKEGKTPTSNSCSSTGESSNPTASPSSTTTTSAANRIQLELKNCKSLKVAQLKEELESYGVSTKSFLEKSEFVRAVAEARVGGAKKSKKKKRRAAAGGDGEVEEVTVAKVEVITGNEGPKTKKTRSADAGGSPFGGAGAGSPFGGAGGMGGMGGMDMGNIADMLKGMGGMGGAAGGGNPFGAAGGANPFGGMGGDPMKAAQQAMSNPKVMAVVQKAQKNPKVMAAVQECMGNPMAMSKYMSDPDVGPILKELQDAMR